MFGFILFGLFFFNYYYSIPSLYVNINKHPQLLPAVSTPAAVPETHNQLTSLPFIIIFNPEHLHTPVKNKQTVRACVRACNKTQAVMNHQKTGRGCLWCYARTEEPPTGRSWYCRVTIGRKNRKNKQPVGSAGQTEWKSALKAATKRFEMISTTNQLGKGHPSVTILKQQPSDTLESHWTAASLSHCGVQTLLHFDWAANPTDAEGEELRVAAPTAKATLLPQRVKAALS